MAEPQNNKFRWSSDGGVEREKMISREVSSISSVIRHNNSLQKCDLTARDFDRHSAVANIVQVYVWFERLCDDSDCVGAA